MRQHFKLGPRNQRRLTHLGIALAVVVAVLVGGMLLHHRQTSPGASKRPFPASGRFAINIGMTETRVRQLSGQPTSKQAACWLYTTNRPIRYLVNGGGTRDGVLTAVKVCFFSNAVYDVRYQIDGKWPPPAQTRA